MGKGQIESMRIIAGTHKGFGLTAPKGKQTRPTTDRVRESLFAMLAHDVEGARVLDAFAGSGALGLEAISRGASFACFVEQSKQALMALHQNIRKTRLPTESYQVITGNLLTALPHVDVPENRYDLVFLDPPYAANLLQPAMHALVNKNVLADDALCICEYSVHEKSQLDEQAFEAIEVRRYGDTCIAFMRQIRPLQQGRGR